MSALCRTGLLYITLTTVAATLLAEEPKQEKKLDAWQTTQAFIDAAIAQRADDAAALAEPGMALHLDAFKEFNIKSLNVVALHADDDAALAITDPIKADHGREGPLMFTLGKKNNRWLLKDIDIETNDSLKAEINRFLEQNPDAKPTTRPAEEQK